MPFLIWRTIYYYLNLLPRNIIEKLKIAIVLTLVHIFLYFYTKTEQGSLTIVRRSSGKKSHIQQQQLDEYQHQSSSEDSSSLYQDSPQVDSDSSEQFVNFFSDSRYVEGDSEKTILNRTITTRMQSRTILTNEELDSVDLVTDNLPAVDTPDACDKAAIR